MPVKISVPQIVLIAVAEILFVLLIYDSRSADVRTMTPVFLAEALSLFALSTWHTRLSRGLPSPTHPKNLNKHRSALGIAYVILCIVAVAVPQHVVAWLLAFVFLAAAKMNYRNGIIALDPND